MPVIGDLPTMVGSKDTKPLSSDIYGISEYVQEIQKENLDGVSDDTLMLGIFGYLGDNFSAMIQNSIVMASEFANESIPTKAKFEKNIIAHALALGIYQINAIPAKMEVFLTFIEDEIINAIKKNNGNDDTEGTFKYDCDNPIYFDNKEGTSFELHPDYDIIIKRVKIAENKFTYTALYDMTADDVYTNPISDIENPYLSPPVVMTVGGTKMLFTACTLRQVEKSTIHKKVLSDNTISSKTVNFGFENQLACFDVDVVNDNGTTHLTPIYEGLSNSGTKYPYLWYTYLDSDTIRLKFDRGSYYPRISSDVQVRLQTTHGQAGNFTWSKDAWYPVFVFSSDRLGYSNITVEVRPIDNESAYGVDKKSIEDLKKIIPKESIARGSITNTTDLQNYFNAIDTDKSKMYFYKNRDNIIDRLYHSFMVMKDEKDYIIPTNTIPIEVDPSMFNTEPGSGKAILPKGTVFKLERDGIARPLVPNSEEENFEDAFYYVIPYNFVINKDPMYAMYMLDTMNVNKHLTFEYINEDCMYQYISTYIKWIRPYLENSDTYTVDMEVIQNITDVANSPLDPGSDFDWEADDVEGRLIEKISQAIKAYVVFYNDEDAAHRYAKAELVRVDYEDQTLTGTLGFRFTFTTDDIIDKLNDIKIYGTTQVDHEIGEGVEYGFMPANTNAMLHILTYQIDPDTGLPYSVNTKYEDMFGNSGIDLKDIIPADELGENWCVTNSYSVNSGVDWFYNFSEIVYSNIGFVYKDDGEEIDPTDRNPVITHFNVEIPEGGTYTFDWVEGENVYRNDMMNATLILNQSGDNTGDTVLPLTYNPPEPGPDPGESHDPSDYPYFLKIYSVPMIRWQYFETEDEVQYFVAELIRRKLYVEEAIEYLEDSFGMDIKFFNTYGPSKLYTIDNEYTLLNRVNLSLVFNLSLRDNYDENITAYVIDAVKDYIENMDEIDSIHMSNLVTEITNKYSDSIKFFEFVSFNGYSAGVQHIYAMDMPEEVITPELANVNTITEGQYKGEPDITIIIV